MKICNQLKICKNVKDSFLLEVVEKINFCFASVSIFDDSFNNKIFIDISIEY